MLKQDASDIIRAAIENSLPYEQTVKTLASLTLPENGLTADILRDEIRNLLTQPTLLLRQKENQRSLDVPDASERIIREIKSIL